MHLFLPAVLLMMQVEEKPDSTGRVFQDCTECPEMVVVPAGSFMMGSHVDLPNRKFEKPLHEVTIAKPFAVGRFEVTFDEWDACLADGGCTYRPDEFPSDRGDELVWGRGDRPVFQVSWYNVQSYLTWLRRKTGEPYRLLTEAEWEYMARAGTMTPYTTGETIADGQANFRGKGTDHINKKGKYERKTVSVGSYAPNAFGIYDVHGNVWEWTQDCWHENYQGAPADGSAWMEAESCERYVLRGGAWGNRYRSMRTSIRTGYKPHRRSVSFGFRVAKSLE